MLALRAPRLRTALPEARRRPDLPFYSGKHRHHGMNLQVIATPDVDLLWVCGDLPGSAHDMTAAGNWQILPALNAAGLIALGDKGNQGCDPTGPRVISP